MDWFRSHHGAPTDPKWLTIAQRAGVQRSLVVAVVWSLLDRASQNEDRGSLDGLDIETLADWLEIDQGHIERIIAALHDKGVLRDNRFTNWEKRQPKREDSSTDRVRRYRERQQTEQEAKRSETHCNATKRAETPDKNRGDKKRKDEGGADAPTAYAFIGKVIRLKPDDFERWRQAYQNIPDLLGELQVADDYYAENPPENGKWFFHVSSWLKRANETALQRKKEGTRGEDWW